MSKRDDKLHRTRYADDALKVEHGTVPSDIRDFVYRRAVNYHDINGTTVWNFNNHVIDTEQLEEQLSDLMYDRYLIPFQASGVWAYMAHMLPIWMVEIEILTYSQKKGEYVPYPNYFRHAEFQDDCEMTIRIDEALKPIKRDGDDDVC